MMIKKTLYRKVIIPGGLALALAACGGLASYAAPRSLGVSAGLPGSCGLAASTGPQGFMAYAAPTVTAGASSEAENTYQAGPGKTGQGSVETSSVPAGASAVTNGQEPGAAATPAQPRLIPDSTSNNYAGKTALPIFRVRTEKPLVALSFDAGSDRGQAEAIMDILEKYGLKSTFFLTADWMRQNPEDAKSIVARGHEIGNHSVNHPSFPKLSAQQMAAQIRETHSLAKELTGVDMCLFRFPYGDYSNTAVDTVKNCGYYGIQWSVDSIDWRNEGREIIINRVLNHKNLGNGSIVLMHMAATYTPSALEEIIQGIQAKGYSIVPVSQLIYENHYHMDYAGNQIPDAAY